MREDFNKQVFESMPDSVWTGKMPDLDRSTQKSSTVKLVARRLSYVAAVLCIPFAAATLLLSIDRNKELPTAEPIAQSEIVYKVNNALQGNIVLPDSTLVTLNSGSTLRLAQDFGTETRTVRLDGEAFFDVHHNRRLPFIIETPQGVEVKVTGTKFNMSCYSDSKLFDLTLLQGSVEVTTQNNKLLHIAPSQEVIIKEDFFNISTKEAPEEALAWTEGILRFEKTPMNEVIAQIERWYGVDIVVEDDSVLRSSFSAEFHSETLNEVLQLLCISSRLNYSVDDKVITLKPRS